MSNHPDKKRKKRNHLILAVSALLLLAVPTCCCCGYSLTGKPASVSPATTGASTDTPQPTETPRLANIPFPTVRVPTPTNTPHPTPAILTCEDIERARDETTDLQWENYTQEIVGEWIYFAGEIIEVYDDGRVQIDDCEGFLNVCMLYEIPLDVAVTFDLGQPIEGVGTVREVGTFLGLYVWINVDSVD